jgi:hypothetical protein
MIKLILTFTFICLLFSLNIDSKDNTKHVDYVPDSLTAIKIAETIWLPIYGEKIYKNQPFKAKLINEVWFVNGTLPNGFKGGVPCIEINKYDCKVVKVYHGK